MRTLFFLFALFFALPSDVQAAADEVRYLARPEQSLSAFVTAAAQARKSIDLTTFIFEPCHSSTQVLLDVLAERARAGVRVRILLDAVMQKKPQQEQLAAWFSAQGIDFRLYNPSIVYNPGTNLRSHVKLMVVDGESYITGGRNISDEYFGLSDLQNWIDRDVLVRGASAPQAVAAFREMWGSRMVERKPAKGAPRPWPAFCGGALEPTIVAQVRDYLAREAARNVQEIPARVCRGTSFVTDSPEFGDPRWGSDGDYPDPYMTYQRLQLKRATRDLLTFVDATETRLDAENWAFIPIGYLGQSFEKLNDRRVRVRIIENEDMESGPKFYQQAFEYAIQVLKGRFTKKGNATIRTVSSRGELGDRWLLSPTGGRWLVHSKVMVRDGRDALVGSFNLDARSYSTNLESIYFAPGCAALAGDVLEQTARLHGVFERDRAGGRIPLKEPPSAFAKFFAMISLALF